jgi:hypothetical protein
VGLILRGECAHYCFFNIIFLNDLKVRPLNFADGACGGLTTIALAEPSIFEIG